MQSPRLAPIALAAPPRATAAPRDRAASRPDRTLRTRRRALCELVVMGGLVRAGCRLGRALPVPPITARELALMGGMAEALAQRRAAAAHLWGAGLAAGWLGARAAVANQRPGRQDRPGLALADAVLRHLGALVAADLGIAASHAVLTGLGRQLVPPLPAAAQRLGATLGSIGAARAARSGWLEACRIADGLGPAGQRRPELPPGAHRRAPLSA